MNRISARNLRQGAAVAVAAVLVSGVAVKVGDTSEDAIDGSRGIGDVLFPDLGNGGIDVAKYTIDMSFDESLRTFKAVTGHPDWTS
jgi:hypothetical protein